MFSLSLLFKTLFLSSGTKFSLLPFSILILFTEFYDNKLDFGLDYSNLTESFFKFLSSNYRIGMDNVIDFYFLVLIFFSLTSDSE